MKNLLKIISPLEFQVGGSIKLKNWSRFYEIVEVTKYHIVVVSNGSRIRYEKTTFIPVNTEYKECF
jgi:hypothetical protein